MVSDINGERIAKLEAKVETLTATTTPRADFEMSMARQLGGISQQLSTVLDNQKTSDAKFDAHDVRLKTLENAVGGFNSARKALLWLVLAMAAVIAFLAKTYIDVVKHG